MSGYMQHVKIIYILRILCKEYGGGRCCRCSGLEIQLAGRWLDLVRKSRSNMVKIVHTVHVAAIVTISTIHYEEK